MLEGIRRHAKGPIRRLLRRAGYELVAASRDEMSVLGRVMRAADIELLIDVGANQGQYAERMRAAGYDGDIVSFEPSAQAFWHLERSAQSDPRWVARRVAVGESPGTLILKLSANSVSSSLLDVTERHIAAESRSVVVGHEKVDVVRLDTQFGADGRATMVKVDTQGFEKQVLNGLGDLVGQVRLLQVELSLVELYKGQASYLEVLTDMESMGFVPVLILPGFSDPITGNMLQFDVVAKRVSVGYQP